MSKNHVKFQLSFVTDEATLESIKSMRPNGHIKVDNFRMDLYTKIGDQPVLDLSQEEIYVLFVTGLGKHIWSSDPVDLDLIEAIRGLSKALGDVLGIVRKETEI